MKTWSRGDIGIGSYKHELMASVNEETENRGSMWDLDQTLDQPMDEEAGKLKNAYREKV